MLGGGGGEGLGGIALWDLMSVSLARPLSLSLSLRETMSVKSGEMFKIDKGGEMNMEDSRSQDGKPASYLPRAF